MAQDWQGDGPYDDLRMRQMPVYKGREMRVDFPTALRAFRRGSHVHGPEWKCLVLCDTTDKMAWAWDEALNITSISSAGVDGVDIANRRFTTAKGADIRFSLAGTLDQVQLHLSGLAATHIMWLFEPDVDAMTYAENLKQSALLPPEDMLTHIIAT